MTGVTGVFYLRNIVAGGCVLGYCFLAVPARRSLVRAFLMELKNLLMAGMAAALTTVAGHIAQAGTTLTNFTSFKPFIGLGYSPFTGSQSPGGTYPTEAQLTFDITNNLISYAGELRTFGMDGTLSNIPAICANFNVPCFPCAYLSSNLADNTNELNTIIAIGNKNYTTTRGLIVGTESLQNGFDPNQLVSNINFVRSSTLNNYPVGTADVPAALMAAPQVVSNCDFVMINLYAYWAQIPATNAALWTLQQWQAFTNAFPGKRVLIGETDWPTAGTNDIFSNPEVVPSLANQALFLSEFTAMAKSNNIEYFIFEYRDEPWKIQEGIGTVEQNWGIVDSNSVKKSSFVSFLSSNFSLRIQSAHTNSVQLLVQTFERDLYSILATTNLAAASWTPLFYFGGDQGTNQTLVTVTNPPARQFYQVRQNF